MPFVSPRSRIGSDVPAVHAANAVYATGLTCGVSMVRPMIRGGSGARWVSPRMRSRRRCWPRINGAEQSEAPLGVGPVLMAGILRALLFANLGHRRPNGVTVRERHDGRKPSGSAKIASMLHDITPAFASSRRPGGALEQREMRLLREYAWSVFGVIAGNFAIAHSHADTEVAPS
jgi:hypothetical protein